MWYCTSSEPCPRMKMNRKTFFLKIILLSVLCFKLQAAEIKQMFEVNLPVVNQEADIRKAAFEQGFIEVVVRVSGTSLAPVQLELSEAGRMISQYRYRAMSEQEVTAYQQKHPAEIPPKYTLWMRFDDGKLKQLLRSNSLPIWGYQRPNVLIWLAVKDGRNRYLLKRTDQSQIKDAVDLAAAQRGLPIVWPEYDQADQKLIEFTDIWGQFWEPLKQASLRYKVDAIILGRMHWLKDSWQVDWSLLQEGRMHSWNINAVDLSVLTSSGIDVATDHISSRFAVFADSLNDEELIVRINNLSSVKRYAQAAHYLESLAPVKSVYAKEVNQQQVDFHIDLSGDESDLKRIIALGKVLIPDDTPQVLPVLENAGQAPENRTGLQNIQARVLSYRLAD